MTSVTISLPESLNQFVKSQVAEKGFGNVSEYFRSLLRESQAKDEEARLERLLLEGLASERIPLDGGAARGWQRRPSRSSRNTKTVSAREPLDPGSR